MEITCTDFHATLLFSSGSQVTTAWGFFTALRRFPPVLIAKFKVIRSSNTKLVPDPGVLHPVALEGDKLAAPLLGFLPE